MKKSTKKQLAKYADHAVSVVSDIAEIVVHLKTPTVLGATAVAARALSSYQKLTRPDLQTFFSKWDYLDLDPLSEFVLALCGQLQILEEEDTSNEGRNRVVVTTIHGMQIGWITHESWIEGPWIENKLDKREAKNLIARLVWETLGATIRIHQPPLQPVALCNDALTEAFPSATADKIHARGAKFLKAGFKRCILFYGEPGTGKSHIMRHVANRAGGFSLRIRAQDLTRVSAISSAIDLLQPSAVLIDDLDRLDKPGEILASFESVKSSARIFLASVNDIGKLDAATLRPGRFDDWVHVQKLDPGVIDRMLEGTPEEIAVQVRDLPIAYIHEYKRLEEVLGQEEAAASIADLHKRLETIRDLCEEQGSSAVKKACVKDCPEPGPILRD